MSQFKSVITKTVARTELPFKDIQDRLADTLYKIIEDRNTTVGKLFANRTEFDTFYNTRIFYKYGSITALENPKITTGEAKKIKRDKRFGIVSELFDAVDKIDNVNNLEELDEALVKVKRLLEELFVLKTGEVEIKLINMLSGDEQRNREIVDELTKELKPPLATRKDPEAEYDLLEAVFGTRGSSQREKKEGRIIRPEFRGPKMK